MTDPQRGQSQPRFEWRSRWSTEIRQLGRRLRSAAFGDRVGLTIFLGALVFYVAYWRIGFFLTDSTTIANAMVNVADGRLAIVETPYSLTLGSQPGLVSGPDGQAFARNYGHVFVSLPLLWVLDLASLVVDPRMLLAGLWSLLIAGFAHHLGGVLGRPELRTGGAILAAVLFVGNAVTATELAADRFALVALQSSTTLAAGATAVFVYRLVDRIEGRRVGAAAGAAVVLATPVSFWASIPKRHALSTAVVAVTLYCFAVSRAEGERAVRARVVAYAVPGLYALVHPFEALFVLLVLGPLDLLSAPSNSPRRLALVAGGFVLSVVPLFVVNTLISGNPFESPRMLPPVDPDAQLPSGPDLEPGSGGGGGGSGSDARTGGSADSGGSGEGGGGGFDPGELLPDPVRRAAGTVDRVVGFVSGSVADGIALVGDVGRLYHVLLRSGWIAGVDYANTAFETIELALLESFPLLAASLAVVADGLGRVRAGIPSLEGFHATDALAGGYAVVFVLVYLPLLPLHSQITPRYLLVTVPALVYLVARIPTVAGTVRAVPRWLAGGYVASVVVGAPALWVVLSAVDPAVGEAFQLHALLALAAAMVALLTAVSLPVHDDRRIVAVGLAVPAGVTTLFLLLSGIEYFSYGSYALGLVRELSALIQII